MFKNNKGFSLAELLVSLLVISIGLLGLASIFPLATRGMGQSRRLTRAVGYAQKDMEEVKRLGYSDVAPDSYMVETYTVIRDTFCDVPMTNMKKAKVTVKFDTPGGERKVEMVTYLSKK